MTDENAISEAQTQNDPVVLKDELQRNTDGLEPFHLPDQPPSGETEGRQYQTMKWANSLYDSAALAIKDVGQEALERGQAESKSERARAYFDVAIGLTHLSRVARAFADNSLVLGEPIPGTNYRRAIADGHQYDVHVYANPWSQERYSRGDFVGREQRLGIELRPIDRPGSSVGFYIDPPPVDPALWEGRKPEITFDIKVNTDYAQNIIYTRELEFSQELQRNTHHFRSYYEYSPQSRGGISFEMMLEQFAHKIDRLERHQID